MILENNGMDRYYVPGPLEKKVAYDSTVAVYTCAACGSIVERRFQDVHDRELHASKLAVLARAR